MSIRSRYNQYRGINAHLQSAFQGAGKWQTFHTKHISHIDDILASQLPPDYYSLAEESLQFREINLLTGAEKCLQSRADVLVYGEAQPGEAVAKAATGMATLTETYTVAETLVEDRKLMGLVIYKLIASGDLKPVTHIELLSPANKPPGTHSDAYATRRTATLSEGINLVELDYLHERRSPTPIIPSYPDRERGAFPYHILVSNPHPDVKTGLSHLHGFRVDVPVPIVDIPLEGEERISFDFGAAYNITFSRSSYYSQILVDYAALPANFDKYDAEDRKRIKRRMAVIKAAVDAGAALTEIPVELETE